MRKIDISEEHTVPDIKSVLSEDFSEDNIYVNESNYTVEVEKFDLVREICIEHKDNHIEISIDHINIEKSRELDVLDSVPKFMKIRNKILEDITGKSSDERKNDMRRDVIDETDVISFE